MEGIILRDEPSLKLVNSSCLSNSSLRLYIIFLYILNKIPFSENVKGSKNMGNMRMSIIQTRITFPVIVLMAWLPDLERISISRIKRGILEIEAAL